jgi:WD40 repeat protein
MLACASSQGQPPEDLPEAKGSSVSKPLVYVDLQFAKDSQRLLVVRLDSDKSTHLVRVYDTQIGRRFGDRRYIPLLFPDIYSPDNAKPGYRQLDGSAKLCSDGNSVVTYSRGIVRIWDNAKEGKGSWPPKPVTLEHPGEVMVAFTKDNKQLLTTSLTSDMRFGAEVKMELKLWEAESGKQVGETVTTTVGRIPQIPGASLKSLTLSPDGTVFLTAIGTQHDEAKSVQFRDTKTLKSLGEPLPAAGSRFSISPDGKTLIAISRSELSVWNIADRKKVCSLPTPEVVKNEPSPVFNFRYKPWFAIHPNGKSVLYRKDDHVRLYDMSGEKPVEKLALKHPGQVYWLAISHDGKLAATACSQQDGVYVWNLETGKAILKIPHVGKVEAMEFSPDGLLLATANAADVQLWDLVEKKK